VTTYTGHLLDALRVFLGLAPLKAEANSETVRARMQARKKERCSSGRDHV
jgi:hypothetical protein